MIMMEQQRRKSLVKAESVFTIHVAFVQMKIKFQCKMKIQCNNQELTSEVGVGPEPNTYHFNQDIILTERHSQGQIFTLSIYIVTAKGTKYIAAVAYLSESELTRMSDGITNERKIIKLSKCLDPQATINFSLKDVIESRGFLPSRSKISQNDQRRDSLMKNSLSQKRLKGGEIEKAMTNRYRESQEKVKTQSEIYKIRVNTQPHQNNFLRNAEGSTITYQNVQSRSRLKSTSKSKIPQRYISDSQANRSRIFNHSRRKSRLLTSQVQNDDQLVKMAYEHSQKKLREKLRRESLNSKQSYNAQIELQEQSNKSRIDKLRSMLEQQEFSKKIDGYTKTISQLQQRNYELEGTLKQMSYRMDRSVDIDSLREIEILEARINEANSQLEELRTKSLRSTKMHSQTQNILKKEQQRLKSQNSNLQHTLQKLQSEKANMDTHNQSLLKQLSKRSHTIEQLQRQISHLSQQLTSKELQIKNRTKDQEQKQQKIKECTQKIYYLQNQRQKNQENYLTLKTKITSIQLNSNHYQKNRDKIEGQLQEALKFKDKYNEAVLEIKKIEGQRKIIQRNYENNLQLANNHFNNIQNKLKQENQSLSARIKDTEAKCLSYSIRVKELQNMVNYSMKNEIENYRKQNQRLQKEYDEAKSNERNNGKQARMFELKASSLTSELEQYKNKWRSLETHLKIETERQNAQMRRLKEQNEQQLMRGMGFRQKQSKLAAQNNLLENRLKAIQEGQQRQLKILTEKCQFSQKNAHRLQQDLKKHQNTIKQLKQHEKDLITKIKYLSSSENQYTEIIKNYEYQISKSKQQIQNKQQKIKQLSLQNSKFIHSQQDISNKNQQLSNKISKLEKQYQQVFNQCENLDKLKQKNQYQIENLISNLEGKEKIIEKLRASYEQQNKEKVGLREELMKNQLMLENGNKQQERFRQYLADILLREIAGLESDPNLGSMMKQSLQVNEEQNKTPRNLPRKSLSLQLKTSRKNSQPQEQESFSQTNIINMLNNYSRHTKLLLTNWCNDHRILTKDHQILKEEHEKTIESYNRSIEDQLDRIKTLEYELSKCRYTSEQLTNKLSQKIQSLQSSNYYISSQLEQQRTKSQQLLYTLNGLKMQKESQRDYHQRVSREAKQLQAKLQQNIHEKSHKINKLEAHICKLQEEIEQYEEKVQKCEETIKRNEQKIKEINSELELTVKLQAEGKNKNKQLVTKISELELLYANEQEKYMKNVMLIEEEEKKSESTKSMINDLIKQKQAIIKQEINNSQRILQLQSQNFLLKDKITDLQSSYTKSTSQAQHLKSQLTKLLTIKKQQQLQQINNLSTINKLTTKVSEKEKKIKEFEESIKLLKNQNDGNLQEMSRSYQKNKEELLFKQKILEQDIENYKLEVKKLQEETIMKLNEEIRFTNFGLVNGEREIQTLRADLQSKKREVEGFKNQCEQLIKAHKQSEQSNESLIDQLRMKDQKIYQLEEELALIQHHQKQNQTHYQHQLKQMHNTYQQKQQILCEEYEAKIQQFEKERAYLKNKIQQAEIQIRKLTEKYHQLQAESNSTVYKYQEKLIKSQEEKNNAINQYKYEITKLKNMSETKEEENVKKMRQFEEIVQNLEIERKNIKKLEGKVKEQQSKKYQLEKEIAELKQSNKKKQLVVHGIKESHKTYQWTLERQVRKGIQTITKAIVDLLGSGESPERKKCLQSMREVENTLVKAINGQNTL